MKAEDVTLEKALTWIAEKDSKPKKKKRSKPPTA